MSRTRSLPRAGRPLSRGAEAILGATGLLGLIGLWQLLSATGILPARAIPAPTDVATALVRLAVTGEFWSYAGQTAWATLLGTVLIVVIAVPLAMAIHASRFVDESSWFVIEFLKPIPGVALIPLAILIAGPTDGVRIFLIIFGALWPMLTQLVYGFNEVSGLVLDTAKSYRFSLWQRVTAVSVPSVMPFALTGLRISVTIALVIAVVTEYIVGIRGLGSMLAEAQLNGVIDQAFALLVFSGILGLAFSGAVAALSAPLLFWHPSQRERQTA
ncbi:ABC transporter permease [Leucobacter allii]|uniref:ABC transporter permease n=1 Tax=Leucobacter allii TaxID=2932247 RepID=A0ABY4FR85_9MICO|nr:ABC transporter permease [Leucobacter allii]UOQ58795.1 ABC transporter permease [Leucobacter allii]